MQLFYAFNINYLIIQKITIPLEDCQYHWHFICCPIWDFHWDKSLDGLNANPSPQHGSATKNNNYKPTSSPQTLPDREDIESDFESPSHKSLIQRHKRPILVLSLDLRLQTIGDPITIKTCSQPYGLLNKKRSWKDITFGQSTCRNLSLFKYRKCKFSAPQ